MKKVTSLRRYRVICAAAKGTAPFLLTQKSGQSPGDGQLLATAETNWAFVDLASGKPMRIPSEIAAAFTVVQR